MTEDSKQFLLDYMMGQLSEKPSTNEPILSEIEKKANLINSHIGNWAHADYTNIRQIITDNMSDGYILVYDWGINRYNMYDDYFGAIAILDNDFNLVQEFPYEDHIECLKFDDEGYLYGVTQKVVMDDPYGGHHYEAYFSMFNKVLAEHYNGYKFELRKNYVFPSQYSGWVSFDASDIFCTDPLQKEIGNATYYLAGTNILKLKINVGEENEWTELTTHSLTYFTSYLTGQSEDVIFKVGGFKDNNYTEYQFKNDELTKTVTINGKFQNVENASLVFLNDKETYIAIIENNKLKIYQTDYTTNSFKLILDKQCYSNKTYTTAKIISVNNILFVVSIMSDDLSYYSEIGLVYKNIFYYKMAGDVRFSPQFSTRRDLPIVVKRQHNLYYLATQEAEVNIVRIIHNSENESYDHKKSLIPNSGILYSKEKPVFARNLYNKTLNGASTVSSIEIPNTSINNVTINKKNLLSQNNNIIISDTEEFSKNIYETVYLNFINTIRMSNQNTSEIIYNPEISVKLNQSINDTSDYNSIKLTKYRLNFEDGTNTVGTFQINSGTPLQYVISVAFKLPKKATNLELISNDETLVYCTIDLSKYEPKKTYLLEQTVRIGGDNKVNN